jgi:hypothetical protein
MRGLRGRNRTANSTEMTHPSGQDWVKEDGGAGIDPSACAVPPPGQRGRHGTACPTGQVELGRPRAPNQPSRCRGIYVGPSRQSLLSGRPGGWNAVTVVSLLCSGVLLRGCTRTPTPSVLSLFQASAASAGA